MKPAARLGARRIAGALAAGAVSLAALAGCGSHPSAAPDRGRPRATTTTTTGGPGSATTTTVPAVPTDPLTGTKVSSRIARRPAVVVKIDNIAAALPQTGVERADVVYEEMVEGGLTRLAAVFQTVYPASVGPVRSGRLTDEGIADDLGHPVLAFSGANGLFLPVLMAQPVTVVDDDNYPGIFERDPYRVEPHNLYGDVAEMAAADHPAGPPPALWSFRAPGQPFGGAGSQAAAGVSVEFPAAVATWTWDAHLGLYLRTQDGAPDSSAGGHRLAAANVIVQWIPYVTSAYVSGEGPAADGDPIPKGVMVGSGTAWFFSGGRLVKGHWSRSSLVAPTRYTDDAGRPVALARGRTWVELPAVGAPVTTTP
ncbi:MAG: DUF3048 domain-containing protein [Actinomycetota bacterium]|nr:DUF3048 domain-containing protein [Actinomycetota bacterium]